MKHQRQKKSNKKQPKSKPGNHGRTKRYDVDGNYIKYTGRLVKGIGICDIPGTDASGKHIKAYKVWAALIGRCYASHKIDDHRNPTYADVVLDKRWLRFSAYKKFHDSNYVDGYALDKDLRVPGNKVYGPDTCAFVPRYINNLLLDRHNHRGKYPYGVTYIKRQGTFQVQLSKFKQRKCLGYFKDPVSAASFYIEAKYKHVIRVLYWAYELGHIDEDVYHGMLMQARKLRMSAATDNS